MKRLIFLVALLLVTQGAWAQQGSAQTQEPPKPAAKPKPVDPADRAPVSLAPHEGSGPECPSPDPELNARSTACARSR